MQFVKTAAIAAILATSIGSVVVAKGHDQSTAQGDTATSVTACSAFTLGGALGGGTGPSGYPAISC